MMHYVSHHTNSKLRVEQSTAPALSPWQKMANAIVEQAVKDYRMEQSPVSVDARSQAVGVAFVPIALVLQRVIRKN